MARRRPRQTGSRSTTVGVFGKPGRSWKWVDRGRLFQLVALTVLGVAIGGIYSQAARSPLMFDDLLSIVNNRSVMRLWPLVGDAESPGPFNIPDELPTSGRPLVNYTFALNYGVGQLNPIGYHIFNFVLHFLSSAVLSAIVRRTLLLDFFDDEFASSAGPLSLAIALLWAVHPLATEAVAYVTQRTELTVGLFYLSTLYSAIRYWTANEPKSRRVWLIVATLACLAGAASKEVIVSAPLLVLLYERVFLAGSFRSAFWQSWPLYVGLSLGWLLLAALNLHGPRSGQTGFHHGVPAYVWWLTQAKVLLIYLKLAFWPWPLLIHYEVPYLTTFSAAWPWVLPVVGLAIATLVLIWHRVPAGYLGAWVFLILSPTLIVPIVTEVAAERRMYLPLAAIVTFTVVGMYRVARWAWRAGMSHDAAPRAAQATAATIIGLVIMFSFLSVRRLDAYHDAATLWQDVLRYHPDDPWARSNHGEALLRSNQISEAIGEFREALRLKPDYVDARFNLGVALAKTGQISEAIDCLEQTVKLRPTFAAAHSNLALALSLRGRSQEAINHFQEALRLNPSFAPAWINLASEQAKLNETANAISSAETALRLARAQGQSGLAQQIEEWLNSYRAAHRDATGN